MPPIGSTALAVASASTWRTGNSSVLLTIAVALPGVRVLAASRSFAATSPHHGRMAETPTVMSSARLVAIKTSWRWASKPKYSRLTSDCAR